MKFKIGDSRIMKPVSFGSILPSVIEELNLQDSFIIENIRKLWEDICGGILSTHSRPDRIFKKTLFISVDHSIYSNELYMMKEKIIDLVNTKVAPDIIRNMKTEIKRIKWNK